jgi:lysophospholipase L1-like esterase
MKIPAARSLLWLSAAPAAAFLYGIASALSPGVGRPVPRPAASPREAPGAGGYRVLALGDSLTRGRGDPGGGGYVGAVARELGRAHPGLRLDNLGIDGLETAGLLEMIDQPNVRRLAREASLILVSIGGNDLAHVLEGRRAGQIPEAVASARQRARANLAAILQALRRENPSATIRVLTLYDPFFASAAGADVVLDWNAMIARDAVGAGATPIPLFDLFEGHPERLAADHFHPNPRGYGLIGRRILDSL